MSTYTVYFVQPASATVRDVEADDSEDAIEQAYQDVPGALCHHCARKIELAGEWEPESVYDADGNAVWEAGR